MTVLFKKTISLENWLQKRYRTGALSRKHFEYLIGRIHMATSMKDLDYIKNIAIKEKS